MNKLLKDGLFHSKRNIDIWLGARIQSPYVIHDDLSVDVKGRVNLLGKILVDYKWVPQLPVQFGTVNARFDCSGNKLKTLKGSPKRVGGSFTCSGNFLETLDNCPEYILNGDFYANANSIKTLHNFHKHFKGFEHTGKVIHVLDNQVGTPTHLLGLLFVKNLFAVAFDDEHISTIINKHLAGDRDPLKCQEELIQSGFAEYAKI